MKRKHMRKKERLRSRANLAVVATQARPQALGDARLGLYVTGDPGRPSVARFSGPPPYTGNVIRYPFTRMNFCCYGMTISERIAVDEPEPQTIEVELHGVRLVIPVKWTQPDIRAWLGEAMEALWLMDGDWPAGYRSAMPIPVRAVFESYGLEPAYARPQLTPEQIARVDYCLPWLFRLDVDTRKAVVGVALGLNLRAIGKVIGCSHTQARKLALEGEQAVADYLNAESALQTARLFPQSVAS